jgi:hypothetical protein
MSFSYPAGTWTPKTAAQHANDILNSINTELQANGVLDSLGNPMVLQAIASNEVWIQCLAIGQMRADDDLKLLAASQMFSVQQSSDQQILNVLPIAGTSLIPAAYSIVTLTVTADSSGATVPAGSVAPYGTICNFLTLVTTVIAPSGSAQIQAQANVAGPIAPPVHALNAFNPTVAHVATVDNPSAAVLGRLVETVTQVRQRLLQGNTNNLNLNGTIVAVESIQGITAAQIYLNTSPTVNMNLQGGISIPPLKSYIVFAGTDLTGVAVANAYAARMLIDTFSVGPGSPAPYTRTDISFAASDQSVNTAGGNFTTAGFVSGQWIQITDGTPSPLNNGLVGLVGTVTATKIILSNLYPAPIQTEGSGSSVTLTVKNVQPFVSAGGQKIPIQYDLAVTQNVYAKVFYELGTATATGFDTSIKAVVAALAFGIGAPVTAAAIMQALAGFAYARITSAQVSTDGSTWVTEIYPNGNAIAAIPTGNITVING